MRVTIGEQRDVSDVDKARAAAITKRRTNRGPFHTWAGVLFSLYLRLLEPFVIGATCVWCLTSAVLITTIFHLLTTSAQGEPQLASGK
ncbi:MAG TPA: vitamin K epoxide reductase family protein [Longimicrobiales bacterium]|nr:vitamin K epoxide reductase family protein [Longimicrobiales bacterium]